MATANIQTVERQDDGRIRVVCVIVGDSYKSEQTVYLDGSATLESLKAELRRRLASLAGADIAEKTFPRGDLDLTPPAPQDPSPAAVAANQFFADLSLLRAMLRATDFALSDKAIDVDAQRAKVQGEFKAEYLSDPRFY